MIIIIKESSYISLLIYSIYKDNLLNYPHIKVGCTMLSFQVDLNVF